MKEIFNQTLKSFQKLSDVQHNAFILQFYTDTYKDEEKANAVNDEVNAYFNRVDSNYLEIQDYKLKGLSRNKWFEEKLEQYEQNHPGFATDITNSIQEAHNKQLKDLGVEEDVQQISTPFSGVGKRIVSKVLDKSFTENAYLDFLQTDVIYDTVQADAEPELATKRYFEEKLDSPYDKTFKKLGTAIVLRVQETGKLDILKDKTPTDIAAIVDRSYTTAKVGYKIATGEMQASDATDYLIDRGVARVEAIIHNTSKRVGGQVGQKLGAAVGSYFGPAGAAIGAKIGKLVGEKAGEFVAKKISTGVKKVASYAKEKVGSFVNTAVSVASSAWNTFKSWF
ncbi:hypothetical protein [Lysinibacillus boronitolerans]|uniref:hypothetical protein n=1 Tax=Lysinibacillus boronitolerans TaxID=309788 RepID=UPI0028A107CD|nr:hypothetical protein [Bacillus mobilis]